MLKRLFSFFSKKMKGSAKPTRRIVKSRTNTRLWIFVGLIALGGLFGFLQAQGVQTWHSGDIACGGSTECNGTFTILPPTTVTNYLGEAVNITELCFGKDINVVLDKPSEVSDLKFWIADRRFREDNPLKWKPWSFNGNCIKTGVNSTFKLNGTKSRSSTVKWAVAGTDIDPLWKSVPNIAVTQSRALTASLSQPDPNLNVTVNQFMTNGTRWNLTISSNPLNTTHPSFSGHVNVTNRGRNPIRAISGLGNGKVTINTFYSERANGNAAFNRVMKFEGDYTNISDVDFEIRLGNGTAIVVVQPTGFIAVKNDFANWTFNTNQAMLVKWGQPNGSTSGEYGNGTNIYVQDGFAQMAPSIRIAGGSWCLGANSGSVQTTLNWSTNFLAEIGAVSTTCSGTKTLYYTFFNWTGAWLMNYTDAGGTQSIFAESWQGGVKPWPAPSAINYKGNVSTSITDTQADGIDLNPTNWGVVARKPGNAASNWSCMYQLWNNTRNVARGPGQLGASMGLSGGSLWNSADRPWKWGDVYGMTNATQTDCSAQLTAQYNESFTNVVTSAAYIGSILNVGDRNLLYNAVDNGSVWVQFPLNNSAAGYGVSRAAVVELYNTTTFPGNVIFLSHRAPGESTWIQDCYISPTNATVQSDANMCAIGNTAHGYPAFLLYQQDGVQNMEYLISPHVPAGADTTAPTITFTNEPVSRQNYSDRTPAARVYSNQTDDTAVTLCTRYLNIDGVVKVDNATFTCNTAFFPTLNASGQVNVSIRAYDAVGNGAMESIFFNYDTNGIIVRINSTIASNYTNGTAGTKWVNFSTDYNMSIAGGFPYIEGTPPVGLTANNSASTLTNNYTSFYSDATFGDEGNYSYNGWANSSYNYIVRSGQKIWRFYDASIPFIRATSPLPDESVSTVTIDIAAEDSPPAVGPGPKSGIASCFYAIDTGANTTIASCANGTTPAGVAAGNHTLYVFTLDKANNLQGNRSFFTKINPPSVTISSPENTTYVNITGNNVWVNTTIVTNGSSVSTVVGELLFVNGTRVNNTLSNSSGLWNYYWTGFSEGTHEMRIYATDSLGAVNGTQSVVFTVFNAPQQIWELPFNITGIASANNFSVDLWLPINSSSYGVNFSRVLIFEQSKSRLIPSTTIANNDTHIEIVFDANVSSTINYTYYAVFGDTAILRNRFPIVDMVNRTNMTHIISRSYVANLSGAGSGTPCLLRENLTASSWDPTGNNIAFPRILDEENAQTGFECGGGTRANGTDNTTFANISLTNSDWLAEMRFYPRYYSVSVLRKPTSNNYTYQFEPRMEGYAVSDNFSFELQNATTYNAAFFDTIAAGSGGRATMNYSVMYNYSNTGRALFAVVKQAERTPWLITQDYMDTTGGNLNTRFGALDKTVGRAMYNSTGSSNRLYNRTGNIIYFGFGSVAEARNASMLLANDTTLNVTTGTAGVSSFVVFSASLSANISNFSLNISSGNITFNTSFVNTTVNWTNATPVNQTASVGVFNVTNLLGATTINLTARVNETLPACFRFFISNSSTLHTNSGVTNVTLNTTYQQIYGLLAPLTSQMFWFKAFLLNCSAGTEFGGTIDFDGVPA